MATPRIDTQAFNALLTTTTNEYLPKWHDQLFIENPLLNYFKGDLGNAVGVGARGAVKGEQPNRTDTGGAAIFEPLLYQNNSTVKSYSGGETIDTTLQDGVTNARYEWIQYAGTVGLTGKEKFQNRGKHQVIRLLGLKLDQLQMTFSDIMSQHIWSKVVGNNGKDITGIPRHISNTISTGGLSVTDLDGQWKSQNVDTVAFSTGNAGIQAMNSLFNQILIQKGRTSIIFTTPEIYEFYFNSLLNNQRFQNTVVADAGFTNLTFNNVPIVFDSRCPEGEMYYLDSRHITWVIQSGLDFVMSEEGFQRPIQQDLTSAQFLFAGQTTTNDRRRMGTITNVTA